MPSIDKQMPDDGPMVMYDETFRSVLEDHMSYLKRHPQTERVDIQNHIANKHHGDFIGVMQWYDIPPSLHWIVMRVNGFSSPMQYSSDMTTMLVPSNGIIDRIVKVHRANHKIANNGKK
jgi:hypothetical protein